MRRFEYTDDKSAKFWEIEQSGTDLNIRWGRIGTAGQSQTKNFADAAKAGAAMQKLITEKTGKGYAEAGTAAGAAIGTAPAKAAPAKAVRAPAVAAPASAPASAPADDGTAPAAAAAVTAPPQAAAAQPEAAPPEDIDLQIERAFEAIRAQIADGTLASPDDALTPARIRRAHGIGELAAAQVSRYLADARLVNSWSATLTHNARDLAIALGQQQDAAAGRAPAAIEATSADATPDAGAVPPWLAQGEPIRLGGPADHTRRLARATQRHPQPVDAIDPERSWQQVRVQFSGSMEPDVAHSDPTLRDAFDAAWRSLADTTPAGTAQVDAILLALCIDRYRSDQGDLGVKLVDHIVMRAGLPHAVEALLEAMRYAVDEEYVRDGPNVVRLQRRTAPAARHYYSTPVSHGEWRLRAHLAGAPQDVYDACAARVREAIETHDPVHQVALALLFPDLPELTHDVIARLGAGGAALPLAAHWLQLTATDPAALALARKVKSDGYDDFWRRGDMVATVLLEHRLDAVRWLAPGAAADEAGDALARIGTPESLDAVARVASTSKPALARFNLAVERWPAAATAALARLLGGSVKDQGLLMPTLLELVRRHPALPAALRPWLEPSANALLDTVQARLAGPTDVAGADDLPEVLARVPWEQPKKKAAAPLQLAPLPLAAVEHWSEGEREAILKLDGWYVTHYEEAARSPDAMTQRLGRYVHNPTAEYQALIKAMRDAIAQQDPAALLDAWHGMLDEKRKERWFYYSLDGHAVAHLPPKLGIPFWNVAATEVSTNGTEFVAATWGLAAFPGVLARIGSAPTDNLAIALHFGAVELAPIAARAFARLKSLRALGRAWLKRFPEHAACALIAPALGKPNEARDCAASSLRYLASIGHGALLDDVAGRYGRPEVLPALHAMLSESPLDRYPNKRPALPGFWKPSGWHRPELHDGKALPDAALDALGTMMAFPTNEEVYAGLYQVRDACTPQSLADFAWDCFSAWLNGGAPSKENWALLTLGIFGNDDTARKLTPFIRAWPGEAAHARAVTGLDVLASIGSDVALMLLNGIAQKVKFKGLQDKAREKIAAIAEARGLSPEELEDRLAPDLGLDDAGSLVLDFGPRAFKVGFDEALKPYVREWQDGRAGARLPDLPKPKKTDDAALAAAAVERFKLLKKDARTIASQQVLRLEVAMCERRRWSPDVFAQFLAGHPLVRHLVRRLVWGVYAMPVETQGEGADAETRVASYGGVMQACFRVAEDGEFTTADDDPFTLPEGEQYRIGLPHALELPADQAAAFGQLLADYELLQPFPQLGRDTYALSDAERAAKELLRWKGVKVPTGKVMGLANIGWRRGPAQDGGGIWTYDKRVDTARTIELTLDPGIIVGMVDEYPEQTLGDITLGRAFRAGWNQKEDMSAFDSLDPILASELIRDMERLRS